MATGDVWRLVQRIESEEGDHSINLHYQVTTDPTLGADGDRLCVSFWKQVATTFRDAITGRSTVRETRAYKLASPAMTPGWYPGVVAAQEGTQGGEPLPAGNSVGFNLGQVLFPAESNGRVWLPGIPIAGAVGRAIETTFYNTEIAAISLALLTDIVEDSSGDGVWRLVVLSRKELALNPSKPDDASGDVVSVVASPRLGQQLRRAFDYRKRKPEVEV